MYLCKDTTWRLVAVSVPLYCAQSQKRRVNWMQSTEKIWKMGHDPKRTQPTETGPSERRDLSDRPPHIGCWHNPCSVTFSVNFCFSVTKGGIALSATRRGCRTHPSYGRIYRCIQVHEIEIMASFPGCRDSHLQIALCGARVLNWVMGWDPFFLKQ